MLGHYYGMTPDEVSALTITQINYLVDMVGHVSPWSKNAGKSPVALPEDLHKLAEESGMSIPAYKAQLSEDDDDGKPPLFMGE